MLSRLPKVELITPFGTQINSKILGSFKDSPLRVVGWFEEPGSLIFIQSQSGQLPDAAKGIN